MTKSSKCHSISAVERPVHNASASRITRIASAILAAALISIPWSHLQAAPGGERLKSTPAEQKSVGVTVYSNLGLVKDVRLIRLPKGEVALTFEGVAAKIDPTSVYIRSIDHPDELIVLEQNFEYDLITRKKLMEKYLEMDVELIQKDEDREKTVQARLLGMDDGYVFEIGDKIAINPPGRVVLPSLPEGLISKPSLVWLLENERAAHAVEASYLTEGIGWKADYVAVLTNDDTRMDLSGWVTIDNRSGATYKDASLKLVAGDVHRVQRPRVMKRIPETAYVTGARREEIFEEEAFFEYHLYTLQRPTTIKDNQTKQLSLFSATDVAVEKSYVYSPKISYFFSAMRAPERGKKVGVFISVENKKESHLGIPLPKGIVRVYKKDRAGDLQFVGEDWIDHTPEDEKVRVKMGEAFDLVAERTQTSFEIIKTGHIFESSFKISIRNHKKEDVVVSVIEQLQGDWKIVENSHDYVKESSHRVRFDVPVPGKDGVDLTYTVRIKR